MPLPQAVIDKILAYAPRPATYVKGRDIDDLLSEIKIKTGIDYDPMTPPRPWQLEALTYAISTPRNLMFVKMRLGKTKFFLDWADHLKRCKWWQGKGLIIVPRPVLLSVWAGEVQKHSRLKVATASNEAELRKAVWSDCDLIVLSWYLLQSVFTVRGPKVDKKGKPAKRALLPDLENLQAFSRHFEIVCIDEIHLCKNPDSLRFQIASIIAAECRYFSGLTGTPHGRNPFDLWAQTYLVDGGNLFGRSPFFFKAAFGEKKYNHFSRSRAKLVFDKSKSEIIEKKLASISLSYGWKGNIDTREPLMNIVKLEMSKEQRKIYYEVIDQLVETSPENFTEMDAVFTRLRQVSSGYLPFKTEDGALITYDIPENPKLEWIDQLLDEIPDDVGCAFFYEYTHTGQAVADLLDKKSIKYTWLYSGTKDKPGAIKSFRDGKTNVILLNNNSGDVGIDLSRADYLCFIESPVSPTVRQQIEARPQAAINRPLIIDDLVVSPVDEKVLRFVKEGKTLLAKTIFTDELKTRFKKK